MEIKRFALGIRFAYMGEQSEISFARKMFEEIFSVLTLTDIEGLQLYGGNECAGEGDVFLAVISEGSHKVMRNVFETINADAAINMYLAHAKPYVEKNYLAHIDGLSYYGQVQKSGMIEGGDGTLDGLVVPKKRGKRSPVGKGIKILLAPENYGEYISGTDAIKLMTVAARKHFQGAQIIPMPINYGDKDFVNALMAPGEASRRFANVTRADRTGKIKAEYGVLKGKLAVINTAASNYGGEDGRVLVTSKGIGEIIRRSIDEGLRNIVIGVSDKFGGDCGLGAAKALGIKFFDKGGNELGGEIEDMPYICRADAEYVHPLIADTSVSVFDGSEETEIPDDARGFICALSDALGRRIDLSDGLAGVLAAITGGKLSKSYGMVLDALDFERLLKGVALVVTGCGDISGVPDDSENAVNEIIKRCGNRNVPIAIISGKPAEKSENIYSNCICTMEFSCENNGKNVFADFADAADHMFGFIRIGRDVEKIGAPKVKRKSAYQLIRERAKANSDKKIRQKSEKCSANTDK